MKKVKTALQRITTGVLALVFTVTLAVPKAKAVTGVDDITTGIMAVLVHLESVGADIAVTQGTSLATQNAVTSLATQAGAAGAFGAGVTGASALATIGAGVVAFAGGYFIGTIAYETLSDFVAWIRQAYLTGGAPNRIYISGGPGTTLADGSSIWSTNLPWDESFKYNIGQVYHTQAGASFWLNSSPVGDGSYKYQMTAITPDNQVLVGNDVITYMPKSPRWAIGGGSYDTMRARLWSGTVDDYHYANFSPFPYNDVFPASGEGEKEEVVITPPSEWVLPAPTPGQVVEYRPYPNNPDKTIEDIIADVPQSISDGTLSPLPPTISAPPVDPDLPPTDPDLPPVNPNPPVDPPAEVQPYTVQLGDVFPFCIPFDLYHMVTLFVAEPEAPHAKWEFSLPFAAGTYEVEWDLQEWDEVAALCRKMELILFCVGLAVVTYKLIKW